MDKNGTTILNGRYEIIRPIGYGGMAEVFLAHDQLLDRDVAVKMLRDQFLSDKELLQQFQREAKSAARLVHPYIINIYDVVSDGSSQYIVMEYVDGVTLKEYMQEHKLGLNTVLEIGVRLADALEHAHSHNVIHCDIKPQNILLEKNLNPKIADFGIAKMVTNQTMVYSKAVMGSVHYISPEQASGGKITACSDVYSLGIVLFEMLTGKVPYTGNTAVAVAMMHVEKPVPKLADYMENVPEGLQQIIDKALAKRCEDRYANAGQLRRDLLNIKMKLFPFSDEDYTHELRPMKNIVPYTDEAEATVIMKPVQRTQTDDMEATVVLPVKRQEQTAVKDEQAAKNEAKDMQEPMRKRKINYTKLIIFITLCVVAISVVAHFIFNRALKEVVVPDVTNMTVVEAQRLLEENDFKVDLEERYGDPAKFKPGTVMEQSPKAGEKRKQRSLIVLIISKGAELKAVPEVLGMSENKAEKMLLDAGFKIGKITRKHESNQRIGVVLAQSPKALDKAPKGSNIDLVINEGDKEIPNIVGKSVAEAKKMLEAAGLKLGEIKEVNDHSAAKNVVLSCNPNAGVKISQGDAVSISVAAGSGKKSNAYVEFVIPGNKPTAVQLVLLDGEGKKNIYNGTQKGGVRLRQRVEYMAPAKVQLYCNGKLTSEKVL
ncbi:Stk1 family PASTA domain-containing Ser/Thr kinase [uncultured Phascolarctobacterium sp.]|uniref:Stk1 family PASTA domain-containing Ser/Thr kinase n=1 Tax=uncultured Phascolarctobacterium sp. TaxID=512296 RepID=UPI002625C43F|nr:Stk1 family PASTA domain-containing Ser/Thr kinase [uncultured Phascolarctobacterium sp.]